MLAASGGARASRAKLFLIVFDKNDKENDDAKRTGKNL